MWDKTSTDRSFFVLLFVPQRKSTKFEALLAPERPKQKKQITNVKYDRKKICKPI